MLSAMLARRYFKYVRDAEKGLLRLFVHHNLRRRRKRFSKAHSVGTLRLSGILSWQAIAKYRP